MTISVADVNEAVALSSTSSTAKTNKSGKNSEIEDTFSTSDNYNSMEEIAQKYDVTNMTPDENSQLMSDLVKNKDLKLKDLLSSTLDFSKLAQTLYEQGCSPKGEITVDGVTYSKDDTTRNYIEDFQNKIKYRQEHGQDTKNLEKLLNVYQQIDYFHNSSEQAA